LPVRWPADWDEAEVDWLDPHRLIVAGLTDTQAGARVLWHQQRVNLEKSVQTMLEAEGLTAASSFAVDRVRHHETIIRALLAQHHQQPKDKRQ
jgi:hypothetical protein